MSFQPVVPFGGLNGWQFLQRTQEAQQQAYVDSAPVQRATDDFRDRITTVLSAEDLVQDPALLSVALGAFGLDDDLPNKAFIERILADGTTADDALANRLSDGRYRALAEAFGFDGIVPRTQLTGFADDIVARYQERQFQQAVGTQNNDMRLALNLGTELADIVAAPTSGDAKWFAIMGSPPLRSVFEKALGFPSGFGRIDIDQQREQFQDRARATFGTDDVADFLTPEVEEQLVRLFIVRAEAERSQAASGGSAALALLQANPVRYDLI